VAKQRGIVVVFVGHVTKEGAIAGPRVLEHIVDTVLYFEGDPHSAFRLVRAIKNRFGAANELGVFAMTERGLKGVSNPSALFLSQHAEPVPGSAVVATLEGSRPLLVEIQALVDPVQGASPRAPGGRPRPAAPGAAARGAPPPRRGGGGRYDVFLNAVGGVRIDEPAVDLAALLAIDSSFKNRALPAKLVVFGEVGLAGEIRPVQRGQERLREAASSGSGPCCARRRTARSRQSPGSRSWRSSASTRRSRGCARAERVSRAARPFHSCGCVFHEFVPIRDM
jgi:DNA repair protein RadA/Sms